MSSGNTNAGFTRLCKGMAVVLVGGYTVVQIVPSALSYLALIPAKTIPFAWNLITAGYVEQSIYGVVVSTVGLLFIGKMLQPIWGAKEFLMFIFIVNFLTAVCVFITAISFYYVTREESYLYLPISGFQGVLYGLLVGVKQIMPDQELPFLKLRAKVKSQELFVKERKDVYSFSSFLTPWGYDVCSGCLLLHYWCLLL
nr:rhomboid-like protein 19 [Ipomoea batatas]GMC77265.1 rhomboid-like protein 19 [Ipomoea batatas]GMD37842.1 rhomboid-like protein 19 [Ipomoea batatas]